MPKLLSLSRAARLAGVSRSEIQNKIREEDAKTFEGKVTVEVLQELYPHIDMEADPMLDRMQRIKAQARPRSGYSDGWMPEPEMLMSRLRQFHRILVHTKSTLTTSEALVEEALLGLIKSVDASEERMRSSISECISRLEHVLEWMRGDSDVTVTQPTKETQAAIVSTSVRLLPSGHDFLLEGDESILEAGLKAGLYLDHGCSSHNCGKCKCKVVSGSFHKMHNHDYILSARELQEGYILACCYTADSDLMIEVMESGIEEEIPYQEIHSTVRKIKREGDKQALLHLQTPRSQSLRFKAGQQVELITEDGNVAECYIASCPCDGRNLQFMFDRQPGSIFSDSVFNGSLTKQKVLLKGPTGHFLLHEQSNAPALFMACGKGFAPIKSLVEHAINIDNAEELHLIQVGCYSTGSFMDNLCRSWNDSLDNFHYTAIAADTSIEDLVILLMASTSGKSQVEIYLAGPAIWLQALLEVAELNGLVPTEWHCQAVD